MIDHNIVVVNGKEYKAVKHEYTGLDLCSGCSLKGVGVCGITKCAGPERVDENNVIFKPHYRPKASELKW